MIAAAFAKTLIDMNYKKPKPPKDESLFNPNKYSCWLTGTKAGNAKSTIIQPVRVLVNGTRR